MPKNPSEKPKRTNGTEKRIDAQSPEQKKRRNFPVLGTIAVGVSLAVAGTITAINQNNKEENTPEAATKTKPSDTGTPSTTPTPSPARPTNPQTPEQRFIPNQFHTEFQNDGRNITLAIMTEKGGLNRTFVIEKGRVQNMNILPNGQEMPGPQQLQFSYLIFKSEVQGNQRINTRIAEVNITRIGGRLVRVTISGENGAHNIPVTSAMQEQNHFGIAEEAVEEYFATY